MKQDNRGMTLVELIIACAVAVIIMGAATYFIRSALNGYETASDTIDLQMESQVLMEQMSTWIMEGNWVKVIDEADGSKTLVIYEIPRQVDSSKLPIGVSINQESTKRMIGIEDGKLYMKVVEHIADPYSDPDVGITTADATLENCIGEYVTEFTPVVDASNQDKVTVKLKLQSGTREYELEDMIKVRNELRGSSTP